MNKVHSSISGMLILIYLLLLLLSGNFLRTKRKEARAGELLLAAFFI